jgi:hypothetical protein
MMYPKHEDKKPTGPETVEQRVKRLEDERDVLKERVSYLERGQFVVEKANEYAKRFAAYETQVVRLASALEAIRRAKGLNALSGAPR